MGVRAQNVVPIEGTDGTRFHGPPCPKHGTTERYTCNQACVRCTRARAAARPRYGLTQEQVDLLLVAQGGVCAICSADKPNHPSGWQVDHDHATGLARGVLCSGCNTGLGQFRDSISSLRRAVDYLTGDLQASRMFFVREASFAAVGAVEPRERAADTTGHGEPQDGCGRFGKRESRAMSRDEYLSRRKAAYQRKKALS